jgi:hypothetical protein
VLANGAVTEEDTDALSLFRFSKHPKLAPKILEMKSEMIKYNALVKSIKPAAERVDAKGKDTFDLGSWWRENEDLRLTHKFTPTFTSALVQST